MADPELQALLTGKTETHLVPWRETSYRVHQGMLSALEQMAQEAEKDGIGLSVCSAFRSFERQLAIWNAKATGQRALLDDQGRPLDFDSLSPGEVITRILRWSALPGLSRHHWGTDVDVYDATAVSADYKVQLTPEETATQFFRLHSWLDANMSRFGFFRPYAVDLGGIAPEAWHLSYAPLSQDYFRAYSYDLLESTVRGAEIVLKEQILENLPQIYERYFLRICGST